MIPVIIGIASGLLVILIFLKWKQLERPILYGLLLSGIGFLYVGFTWSDTKALVITSVQALFFLFMSWYGIKKSLYILSVGYFLHGTWDLAYNLFPGTELLPPHYDLFCLFVDFTIGIYLWMLAARNTKAGLSKLP